MTGRPTATRAVRDLVAAAALASACAALAQAPSKTDSMRDAAAGKALHDKDCIACHARRFDGDATRIYLRPDHKVKTREQLRAQIAYCNTELGSNYFPEEEEQLAAYLDLTYYRFKP